jgi:hypothetical protein
MTPGQLVVTWTLPFTATLGSPVRARGIFQAARLRLPVPARKALAIRGRELSLQVADTSDAIVTTVSKALEGIGARPVIPLEVEDILAISSTERHRWLKDGRLPSAGTRTVKLRGRARNITFHVFDPDVIEELLSRDAVVDWREEDAATAAENRRRAAWSRVLKRKEKSATAGPADGESPEEAARHLLKGWDEFEREGLLR